MIDEFNLVPPIAPPKGVKYLTNNIGAPLALLVKDIKASVDELDPRDISYKEETVRQFLPGEIITEDMLGLTDEQKSLFISRYIKPGIISDNTLVPTVPTVGIDSVSTCNYAVKLNENGSADKVNISYDTLDHLQIFPASYNGNLIAIYYRDADGISYSLDEGKNIIKVAGSELSNLKYPEEITSCAVCIYTDVYNSSLVRTKLYIGTLREGLKSLTPGDSKFVQETDLEKGHYPGELDSESYYFRASKWNVGRIKSSDGVVLDYLPGEYQPCYVVGILNFPISINNPILVYVKNIKVGSSVTSTITNIREEGQYLAGDLKISGTAVTPVYKFFTKTLLDSSSLWSPLAVSEEIKNLDLCDILKSTEVNSVLDFSTNTPDEVGQIIAVASPKTSEFFVVRLLKYVYNGISNTISLELLPNFVYESFELPPIIDPADPERNSVSIIINGVSETLSFVSPMLQSFEDQWTSFIDTLIVKYQDIVFTLDKNYILRAFSNKPYQLSSSRLQQKDLEITPTSLTGLFCYYDFASNSLFRQTIFITEYDKIWKLGSIINYTLNTVEYSWGSGPWMSSNNIDADYSFRLDKNLNFPFLDTQNKFNSDQLEATTTYLHGLRNFCLYKPSHLPSYIGYCGSDLGLIKFEFVYNPLEDDFRFLDRKLLHKFDRKLYSSWNSDLVLDLQSKLLIGCGIQNQPPIIYSKDSENDLPIRYYFYNPTYFTKPGTASSILKSKLFYKNYSVTYKTESGITVNEEPVNTVIMNFGTASAPDSRKIDQYSAINKYNFVLFQDERRDQVINSDNNFKEFVRIIPRFNGTVSFVNRDSNPVSKFSFINVKSELYRDLAVIPLSVEYPIGSGNIRVLTPDLISYDESDLGFSISEIDSISLQLSRNILASYLNQSTVKYNKYKLKLRVAESPGKVFDPSLYYENDLEFILILNDGI